MTDIQHEAAIEAAAEELNENLDHLRHIIATFEAAYDAARSGEREEAEGEQGMHSDLLALVTQFTPRELASKLMHAGVYHERQLIAEEPRQDQSVTTPSDIERNTYTADRALGLHTARLAEQDRPVDRASGEQSEFDFELPTGWEKDNVEKLGLYAREMGLDVDGDRARLITAIREALSPPDADTAAAEYEETKRRVIAGKASVYEAQEFIDFIEGAITNPPQPLQDGADQHGPNHPAHKHPRQLGDGPMCDCFREGWDSCDSLANARRAKSAQYLRENPDPPLQDGGEREAQSATMLVETTPAHTVAEGDEMVVNSVRSRVRKVEKYEGTPDRQLFFQSGGHAPIKVLDNEPVLRVARHRHQDVEAPTHFEWPERYEKGQQQTTACEIPLDGRHQTSYRKEVSCVACLQTMLSERVAEVERLREAARKLMGAAAVLLFVEHDTEHPERMSENARKLLVAKDEVRHLLAPSPDDRGGER